LSSPILRFDFFCLALETIGQIGKLQTARIIPRQPASDAQA
jgi:hypothetical protein